MYSFYLPRRKWKLHMTGKVKVPPKITNRTLHASLNLSRTLLSNNFKKLFRLYTVFLIFLKILLYNQITFLSVFVSRKEQLPNNQPMKSVIILSTKKFKVVWNLIIRKNMCKTGLVLLKLAQIIQKKALLLPL